MSNFQGIDDYRAKRWVNGKETDGETQGHPDKLFNRKEKKKKRKSRRNKIFRNSANLNGNGPMEAIHLINKLNQLPEVSNELLYPKANELSISFSEDVG